MDFERYFVLIKRSFIVSHHVSHELSAYAFLKFIKRTL